MRETKVGQIVLWVVSASLTLAGCSGVETVDFDPRALSVEGVTPTGRLTGVDSWAYQLQNIHLDDLASSDYDLLVIDPADDDGRPFTQEQIRPLQAGDRLVLSYLSIGEAETYRPYWDPAWIEGTPCDAPLSPAAPGWLDPANPDWCGNYAVRFWDEGWQAIVFEALDAVLAAGFDGVYLDKVDIFYYWLGEEALGASTARPTAGPEMAAFVRAIADYGRARSPDFIVVPQNAPEIIAYLDATQRAAYLSAIDGLGVEDTFFYPRGGIETGNNPPYNPQTDVLALLEVYQAAGVPILAVDYLSAPGKVDRFTEEARGRGFVPYTATRQLDSLTDAP